MRKGVTCRSSHPPMDWATLRRMKPTFACRRSSPREAARKAAEAGKVIRRYFPRPYSPKEPRSWPSIDDSGMKPTGMAIHCETARVLRKLARNSATPARVNSRAVTGAIRPGARAPYMPLGARRRAWSMRRSRPDRCSARVRVPSRNITAAQDRATAGKARGAAREASPAPSSRIPKAVLAFVTAKPGSVPFRAGRSKAQPARTPRPSRATARPKVMAWFRSRGMLAPSTGPASAPTTNRVALNSPR